MTAYLRSVFLAPNRAVFDINKLPIAEYALSMGLSAAPKLKFVNRAGRATQEVPPHFPFAQSCCIFQPWKALAPHL